MFRSSSSISLASRVYESRSNFPRSFPNVPATRVRGAPVANDTDHRVSCTFYFGPYRIGCATTAIAISMRVEITRKPELLKRTARQRSRRRHRRRLRNVNAWHVVGRPYDKLSTFAIPVSGPRGCFSARRNSDRFFSKYYAIVCYYFRGYPVLFTIAVVFSGDLGINIRFAKFIEFFTFIVQTIRLLRRFSLR